MDIREEKAGSVVILRLSGRVDAYTSEQLEEEMESVINSGKLNFVINFEGVNYISSAGLRVFLGAHKKLSESGGKVKFSQMPDNVLRVFALAGFDKIFEIYSMDKDALQDFNVKIKEAV